jgi:hypothetical protein
MLEQINDSEYDWYESEDGQKVRIYVPDQPIVIQMSAGADSSSLMYLLCKYIKDHDLKNASIVCQHFVDLTFLPGSEPYFQKIFSLFQAEFPEVKMSPIVFRRKCTPNPYWEPGKKRMTAKEIGKFVGTKNYHQLKIKDMVREKYPQIKFYYSGRTLHPPKEVREELQFRHEFPERSPESSIHIDDYVQNKKVIDITARPFQIVDKLFVASIYRRFPFLMEKIYPLTYSCLKPNSPCKDCDWCKEKKWAFGTYDFGIE